MEIVVEVILIMIAPLCVLLLGKYIGKKNGKQKRVVKVIKEYYQSKIIK
jgi:hypothetical protein